MTNPLIFHVSWLFVGIAMMCIPLLLLKKFETLEKNYWTSGVLGGFILIGGLQLVAVFFGACFVVLMKEFDPWLCFGLGNIATLMLLLIVPDDIPSFRERDDA